MFRDYRDYLADVEHCNQMRREDNLLFGWDVPLPMLKPVNWLLWKLLPRRVRHRFEEVR